MLSFHSIRFKAEGASGIGVWKNILEFISMASIVVNCAIVLFTSKSVSSFIDPSQFSYASQILFIVLIEHLIIGMKFLMGLFIFDKPSWVIKDEEERNMNEEDLRETIDMMKDEFEEKGGVPLEKMIQEVKKQKR